MPRLYPPKQKRIEIRLPARQHEQLESLAASAGYSVSTLVRWSLTAENVDKAIEQLKQLNAQKAGQ